MDHVSAVFANDLAKLYADTRAALPAVTLDMVVGTFVHQARERLLHDMVELWNATHILWLDSDMTFPSDTALRLLAHDKDVVAVNYVMRRESWRPIARRDGGRISSLGATGLERVDDVGMGVFLMKTSVLDGLPSPHFWYSTPTETEDLYFCRQLRDAGREIWVDHDVSNAVGHVGQITYRERSHNEGKTENGQLESRSSSSDPQPEGAIS
jgi:hypothetical protein